MRFRYWNMSDSSSLPDIFLLCIRLFESYDVVEIRQEGADGINAASIQRGDDIVVALGCKVHSNCRKRYINQNDIANQQKKGISSKRQLKRSVRVSSGAFKFNSKSGYLLCGTVIDLRVSDYSYVKTDQFSRAIRECCQSRYDDWSFTVIGRIE